MYFAKVVGREVLGKCYLEAVARCVALLQASSISFSMLSLSVASEL